MWRKGDRVWQRGPVGCPGVVAADTACGTLVLVLWKGEEEPTLWDDRTFTALPPKREGAEAVVDHRCVCPEAVALRAILEGRAFAPTAAEIELHRCSGGRWRARLPHFGVYVSRVPHAEVLALDGARWWAIDDNDNNCAWPTTVGTP